MFGNVAYSNAPRFIPIRKDKQVFNNVLLHIDFKGAPPTFKFLIDLVKYLARTSKSLTGFLFEFEDMLPFEGSLLCIRSDKYPCYSKEQIQELV